MLDKLLGGSLRALIKVSIVVDPLVYLALGVGIAKPIWCHARLSWMDQSKAMTISQVTFGITSAAGC
jgi:hypothetical protein